MPFPVRLLSDYVRRPLAVAIYAVASIAAMQLQRLLGAAVPVGTGRSGGNAPLGAAG